MLRPRDYSDKERDDHENRPLKIEPQSPRRCKQLLGVGIDLTTWSDLAEGLRDVNIELVCLPSSLQELDQLSKAPIDGILWDFESSSLKGLSVVSRLRRRKPAPPVIIILNASNKKLVVHSLDNVDVKFVTKPLDLRKLRLKCVRLFHEDS